jgi:hypothetical protein
MTTTIPQPTPVKAPARSPLLGSDEPMSAATLEELAGLLTVDQAIMVADSIRHAAYRAEQAEAEAFREQMFGDSRRPDRWDTVRFFTTTYGRRAHVVEQAGISERYDGVRVGDPFVSSACSMAWSFADEVSLDVDGVPICERCAAILAESHRSPGSVGGEA